ncbi:MAG: HAD family hydrolase [Desulfomonile tiedjei]|nr:HAD family hydrolase [Desulfomonile tiedjei]
MSAPSDTGFPKKAIFLDRDGVINFKLPENRYVSDKSQFRLIPGVVEAMSILKELGFLLVVITNQRGIARGFMAEEDLAGVHEAMLAQLQAQGVRIDGIYYCPHEEFEGCDCRKPEPGMILSASMDLGIDLAGSFMVGDSPSDVAAGRRAGTRTVRIAAEKDNDADYTFSSLIDFALFARKGRDESGRREQ